MSARAFTEINLGGGAKYLASWILGISIRYFKLVYTQSNHLESTTLSLLQTKLAEKNIVSKKSTFYFIIAEF